MIGFCLLFFFLSHFHCVASWSERLVHGTCAHLAGKMRFLGNEVVDAIQGYPA